MKVSGQFHTPAALPPGTHLIGGWVDPRAGMKDLEKEKFLTLPGLGLELRPLCRPARSQSVYRPRLLYVRESSSKYIGTNPWL
jgi:hypothetical protein